MSDKYTKLLLLIGGILVLLSVFLMSYEITFILMKKSNQNSTSSATQNTSNTQNNITTIGEIKTNWLANQWYHNSSDLILYQNDTDINTLSDATLAGLAYKYITSDDLTTTGSSSPHCYKDDNDKDISYENYPSDCYRETVDINLLYEQLNNVFGISKILNITDFYPNEGKACNIADNKITCYYVNNSLDITPYLHFTIFDHAVNTDTTLTIYTKLLTVLPSIYKDNKLGIYSDYNATNYLDNLDYYNSLTTNPTSSLFNHYQNFTTYKSIFTLKNNNYYWQSTSLVK